MMLFVKSTSYLFLTVDELTRLFPLPLCLLNFDMSDVLTFLLLGCNINFIHSMSPLGVHYPLAPRP